MRFDGKSYLKYLHGMDEDNQDFKVSLRFKTFQEQSLIMSTNSTNNWGTLQVFISLRLHLKRTENRIPFELLVVDVALKIKILHTLHMANKI